MFGNLKKDSKNRKINYNTKKLHWFLNGTRSLQLKAVTELAGALQGLSLGWAEAMSRISHVQRPVTSLTLVFISEQYCLHPAWGLRR